MSRIELWDLKDVGAEFTVVAREVEVVIEEEEEGAGMLEEGGASEEEEEEEDIGTGLARTTGLMCVVYERFFLSSSVDGDEDLVPVLAVLPMAGRLEVGTGGGVLPEVGGGRRSDEMTVGVVFTGTGGVLEGVGGVVLELLFE